MVRRPASLKININTLIFGLGVLDLLELPLGGHLGLVADVEGEELFVAHVDGGEVDDFALLLLTLVAAHVDFDVGAQQEAVERVLSFFAPDEMTWARSVFANVLVAVLSQALVRRRDETAQALVCELMVSTPAVRQQILQGTTGQLRGIMAQGRRDGHVQMTAQLADRVRRGEIAEEDARYVAHPAEEFAWLMQSAAGGQGA